MKKFWIALTLASVGCGSSVPALEDANPDVRVIFADAAVPDADELDAGADADSALADSSIGDIDGSPPDAEPDAPPVPPITWVCEEEAVIGAPAGTPFNSSMIGGYNVFDDTLWDHGRIQCENALGGEIWVAHTHAPDATYHGAFVVKTCTSTDVHITFEELEAVEPGGFPGTSRSEAPRTYYFGVLLRTPPAAGVGHGTVGCLARGVDLGVTR